MSVDLKKHILVRALPGGYSFWMRPQVPWMRRVKPLYRRRALGFDMPCHWVLRNHSCHWFDFKNHLTLCSQALDRLVATSGSSVMATSSSCYRSRHSQPQIEFTQLSKYTYLYIYIFWADGWQIIKVYRAHQWNSMSRWPKDTLVGWSLKSPAAQEMLRSKWHYVHAYWYKHSIRFL